MEEDKDDINNSESEDSSENKIYSIEYNCDNCKWPTSYDVPKGSKVRPYISGMRCIKCGCDVIQRRTGEKL